MPSLTSSPLTAHRPALHVPCKVAKICAALSHLGAALALAALAAPMSYAKVCPPSYRGGAAVALAALAPSVRRARVRYGPTGWTPAGVQLMGHN
eukprot:1404637-Pyramimonas_sp.AAC.1